MSTPDSSSQRAAWSGDSPLKVAARERLLKAAEACITRDGMSGLGIAAVAKEAGVSRPTVYRYFADRDALLQATLIRAGEAFSAHLGERLEALKDPGEQAVEAVLAGLRAVPGSPVLGEVWTRGVLESSAVQGFTSELSIELTRRALAPLIARSGWNDDEAGEAVEVLLRFMLSLLASPAPHHSEDQIRAFLERRMLPALGL